MAKIVFQGWRVNGQGELIVLTHATSYDAEQNEYTYTTFGEHEANRVREFLKLGKVRMTPQYG